MQKPHHAEERASQRFQRSFSHIQKKVSLILLGVVFLAAAKAEAIIHTYPTHFYDIEEAKAYVDAACEKADLKYITSKHMTEDEMEYVKDRACFIVAAKAFGQGEFYLKVELADPRALRSMYA